MNLSLEKNAFRTLVIASTNKGKVQEFKRLLSNYPLEVIGQPGGLEVEETGKSFIDNARLKAIAAARYTGDIALADDSGLCVKALGGAPGVYSSRYANTDRERIARLLHELRNCSNRSAFFLAALCLASPSGKVLLEVEGRCDGFIASEPRGNDGFGYDPIFKAKATGLTFSEMGFDQKQKISHRALAFQALIPGLKTILNCELE
jgi:XTP/dITP diphosphohydrolase